MSRTSDALRLIRLKFYGTLAWRVEANTSKFPNQALINSRKWFFVRNQKTHTNVQNEKFFLNLFFVVLFLFAFGRWNLTPPWDSPTPYDHSTSRTWTTLNPGVKWLHQIEGESCGNYKNFARCFKDFFGIKIDFYSVLLLLFIYLKITKKTERKHQQILKKFCYYLAKTHF